MDSDGVPPLDLTVKERIDIQDIINGGDKIIYEKQKKTTNIDCLAALMD